MNFYLPMILLIDEDIFHLEVWKSVTVVNFFHMRSKRRYGHKVIILRKIIFSSSPSLLGLLSYSNMIYLYLLCLCLGEVIILEE